MSSKTLGESTSAPEVTHVDAKGMWLFVDGREHYMPFDQFPWFIDASIKQISNVERPSREHMYWPELDVDLTLDMIDHPEKYPLKYKS
jgi:hypothetical protein